MQHRDKKACTLLRGFDCTQQHLDDSEGFCFFLSFSISKLSSVPWLCGVELVVSTSFTGKPQSRQPTWRQVRLNSSYWLEENFRISFIQTETYFFFRSYSYIKSICYDLWDWHPLLSLYSYSAIQLLITAFMRSSALFSSVHGLHSARGGETSCIAAVTGHWTLAAVCSDLLLCLIPQWTPVTLWSRHDG